MARRLASRLSGRARAMMSLRATAVPLLVAGTLGLLIAPPARADGDPASDALIVQRVFYPYTSPIPRSLQATLNAETARLARAGLPLKVAIIGAPLDLGAIPQLFGRPLAYARFLDTEISFNGPQPLLTVMADGFGSAALTPRLRAVTATLPRPAGRSDRELTEAAIAAVRQIAAADGHPLPAPGATTGTSAAGGSGVSPVLILAGLAAAAGLIAAAILSVRRRRPASAGSGAGPLRPRPGRARGRSRRPSRGTGR